MRPMLWARRALTLAACALAVSAWPMADTPLKVIVPAPAGGTMDTVARILGQQITEDTGRVVLVENRAGAVGSIGLQAMLQAPADGNTIVLGAGQPACGIPPGHEGAVRAAQGHREHRPDRAHQSRPRDVGQLPGEGFPRTHRATEEAQRRSDLRELQAGHGLALRGADASGKAGLDAQHVGYHGSPPAFKDVLGGEVDIMFDGMLTSVAAHQGGQVARLRHRRGLTRSHHLPDVPTRRKSVIPTSSFEARVGIIGSPKLKPEVLARQQGVIKKAAAPPRWATS